MNGQEWIDARAVEVLRRFYGCSTESAVEILHELHDPRSVYAVAGCRVTAKKTERNK